MTVNKWSLMRRARQEQDAEAITLRESKVAFESRPVMKPYRSPPDSTTQRRWRGAVFAGVIFFCLFQGLAFAFLAPYLPMFFAFPLVVLGGLVVWSLPDSDRAPVKWIEGCFFALFVSMVLWPNYLAIAIPGFPWLTMVRLTGFPMVFGLLVAVSQSPGFRAKMAEVLSATPWLWKALVFFVAIQFFSIFLSKQVGQSVDKFIVAQVSWTAMYFVGVYVFSKPGRVELWASLLCGMIAVLGLIAVVETRHHQVPWAHHIPSFIKINSPVVDAILAGSSRSYTDIYRTQSTFETSLDFGEYIALTVAFFYSFLFGKYRQFTKIMALILIGVAFVSSYLTHSRSSALGCMVASMLWLLAWGVLQWRNSRQSLFGPSVVLVYPILGVLVLAATLFIGRIRNVIWGGGETVSSTESRVEQWRMGREILLHNPIGHGIGRAAETLNFHQPGGLLTIDSWFLSALLEYGVVGFIVFFGMIVIAVSYAFGALWRARVLDLEISFLIPAAISLVIFVLVRLILSSELNFPIAFMLLGMINALVYRSKAAPAAISA